MPINMRLPAIPYGAHVIILFVLAFATFILNILITFSSPFISSINFLYLPSDSGRTTFGSFGWCSPGYCLPNQVAYEYAPQVNRGLTGAMVLWAVSLIFLFFLLISIMPLLCVHENRALRFVGNRTFFVFAGDLSAIIVVLAWLYSIFGWSIANRTFEVSGVEAHLGPAIWMGLTSALCIVMYADILSLSASLRKAKDKSRSVKLKAVSCFFDGQPMRGMEPIRGPMAVWVEVYLRMSEMGIITTSERRGRWCRDTSSSMEADLAGEKL